MEPFEFKGFRYTPLERKGRVLFVKVYDTINNVDAGYEVVKLKISNVHPKSTSDEGYTHKEFYPREADFGEYGWYFMENELSEAVNKFKNLTNH